MKLLICFGTRPEYIKVKSLIDNLDNVRTLFTGQHKDLIRNINFDYVLTIEDDTDNRLNNITRSILKHSYIFDDISHVLVQGDTTSAFSIGLSAFHNNKKVIHLEAGLRTSNIYDPYPEEMNRQLLSRIASINLCPTEYNKDNLIRENVKGDIYITGNTGLDNISRENTVYGNYVLITMHRRDNHSIMDKWFIEISKLAKKYTDLIFIIPLHPNPKVQQHRHLLEDVTVIDPVCHDELICILKQCRFIISDSGGLQEEASYLNKKIIVCRRTTERPETMGMLSNHSILCPYPKDLNNIVKDVYHNYYIDEACPYGDGEAWKKIKAILN
jgi:UDP-N-acetylglucosamine 2-epimerase (non-hydrolysing)